jgi:hypothetical protein
MAKTFIPGAVDIANAAHKYLSRRQAKLVQGASIDQIAALADLITCLATFLSRWHKPAPNP